VKLTELEVGRLVPFAQLQEIVGAIIDLPDGDDEASAEGNPSTGASSAE
jgi:hypothetical protein